MEKKDSIIIAIDHGYGYTKTVNEAFPSGVSEFKYEAPVSTQVLKWNDTYYTVGCQLDYITDNKFGDDDFFVLTLAAIAMELRRKGMNQAKVKLAVGLPLMFYGKDRQKLEEYLSRGNVSFTYEAIDYEISIDPDVLVFPQGCSGVLPHLKDIQGPCYVVDIGTGTTDIIAVKSDKSFDASDATSLKIGVSDAINAVNRRLMIEHGTKARTDEIIDIIIQKPVIKPRRIMDTIDAALKEFAKDFLKNLKSQGIDYDTTQTFFMGGGSVLITRYGDLNLDVEEDEPQMIFPITDIHANAKGYDYLAKQMNSLR